MESEAVDWDRLEKLWSEVETTMPEARRGAAAAAARKAGRTAAHVASSKPTKVSLAETYGAQSKSRSRRKRHAFGTSSSAHFETTEHGLPQIAVGRVGTPLAMADFDDDTPRASARPQSSGSSFSTPRGGGGAS